MANSQICGNYNYEIHFMDGTASRYVSGGLLVSKVLKERYGDDFYCGEWDHAHYESRLLIWKNKKEADQDEGGAKAIAEIVRR